MNTTITFLQTQVRIKLQNGGVEVNKCLYSRFKELTGYSQSDIAAKFKLTRQYISQIKQNYSGLFKTSFAFMLNIMIDQKIKDLKAHISSLEQLQEEIKSDALKQTEDLK
jgi:transcriptional regulator with XRE-family HTH domain